MRIRNAFALILVAVLLGGCGAAKAGTAATVGGVRISEATLADAFMDLSSGANATQLGITEGELTVEVLNRLVILELVRQLGKAAEVSVSETEIAAERSRVTAQFGSEAALIEAGLQQAIAPSQIDSVFEISLFVSKIGEKLEPNGSESDQTSAFESFLFSYVDSAAIEISPRYGKWDPTRAAVSAPENPLVNSTRER